MSRRSIILWMLIIFGCVTGLYQAKHHVEKLREEVSAAHQKLAEEKEARHVLRAELAYLGRNERIEQLTAQYLKLRPLKAEQIIALDEIPNSFVPVPADKPAAPLLHNASLEVDHE